MSIILDGMDQNKCRIPQLGTQNQFSDPITQHLSGIKSHGDKMAVDIFRTVGTVSGKSPNLTIYMILTKLEVHYIWQLFLLV